ncbi:hypothetical protein JCM18899A_04430 [Nocardioides sp. AN3]
MARVVTVVGERHDLASLSTAERARHDRLVDARDRAAYVAAHVLVRACVATLTGTPVSEVEVAQRCARCGGADHGPPYVVGRPDLHVSLSHARGVAAAVADHAPCGIDVETVAREVAWHTLGPLEAEWIRAQGDPAAAFTRLWVRKEALVKAGVVDLDRVGEIDVVGEDAPASSYGLFRLTDGLVHAVDGAGPAGRAGPAAVWASATRAPA